VVSKEQVAKIWCEGCGGVQKFRRPVSYPIPEPWVCEGCGQKMASSDVR
jgi:ribosomal protein L37AE/L43A